MVSPSDAEQRAAAIEYVRGRLKYIENRWGELYELRSKSLTEGIKYLFLINSGGVVSYLAFLGTSVEMRDMAINFYALLCFVLGLIFVGFYQALQFQTADHLFNEYIKDFKPFLTRPFDHQEYNRLSVRDDERSRKVESGLVNNFSYIFAYGSLFLFICGCVLAGLGLVMRNGGNGFYPI